MMHPGIKDQCGGEDCKSFSSTRGKEREGALPVRPCRHHSFMLSTKSSVTNPQKDTSVWITTPQHDLSWVLTSSPRPPFSSPLPLCCLFPLHHSTSCPCAFFFLSALTPPPRFAVSFATLPSHGPSHFSGHFSPSLSAVSFFLFHYFCISLCLRRTRGPVPTPSTPTPPPFSWTCGCKTWLGFIYIFLALLWSLLLILLSWNNLKETKERWSFAAQDREQ